MSVLEKRSCSGSSLKIPSLPRADDPSNESSTAFDWGLDEEELENPELAKSQTTKRPTKINGCLLWFRQFPLFVKSVLYIICGSIVFMIPGLVSYVFCISPDGKKGFMDKGWAAYDDKDTCGFAIGSAPRIPVFVLMVWCMISWTSYFGNRYIFAVLPNVLVRISSLLIKFTIDDENFAAKATHMIDYMSFLKKFLSLFVWGVTNNFSWAIMFSTNIFGSGETDWRNTIQRILSCFMFGFLILLIEKTFLQVVSVGFHKKAYRQRILDHENANKVLEKLNKGRKKLMKTQQKTNDSVLNSIENADTVAESPNTSGKQIIMLKSNLKSFSGKAFNAGKGFASIVGAAVGIDLGGTNVGVLLRSPTDARILARKLYEMMSRPGYNNDLRLEDFTPFFNSPEEAKEAFSIFDKDGNGDITKPEFRSTIRNIYEEGVKLDVSLRQSSQAISKLDDLFKVFMYIIILFVCLGIFNVDTTKFMAAAISLWLGIVFAIGGTIKNLVESIIFLFITHPYDVGDKVEVNNVNYFVKKFGLMTTVFTGVDGKEIYAPNIQLASKFIHNVRRSGPTGESINFRFSFSTPWVKIKQLETFLREYVETEESRDFLPSIEIKISSITGKECINCFIWLAHKSNWQSGPDKSTRTNRFLLKAKEGIELFDIELSSVWINSN